MDRNSECFVSPQQILKAGSIDNSAKSANRNITMWMAWTVMPGLWSFIGRWCALQMMAGAPNNVGAFPPSCPEQKATRCKGREFS
jgi:hypothetical protein